MSRNNDSLPMLPPWLSESEVTQSGYEAPVENLPQDDVIDEAPKRRRFMGLGGNDDKKDKRGRRRKGEPEAAQAPEPAPQRPAEPPRPPAEPQAPAWQAEHNPLVPDSSSPPPWPHEQATTTYGPNGAGGYISADPSTYQDPTRTPAASNPSAFQPGPGQGAPTGGQSGFGPASGAPIGASSPDGRTSTAPVGPTGSTPTGPTGTGPVDRPLDPGPTGNSLGAGSDGPLEPGTTGNPLATGHVGPAGTGPAGGPQGPGPVGYANGAGPAGAGSFDGPPGPGSAGSPLGADPVGDPSFPATDYADPSAHRPNGPSAGADAPSSGPALPTRTPAPPSTGFTPLGPNQRQRPDLPPPPPLPDPPARTRPTEAPPRLTAPGDPAVGTDPLRGPITPSTGATSRDATHPAEALPTPPAEASPTSPPEALSTPPAEALSTPPAEALSTPPPVPPSPADALSPAIDPIASGPETAGPTARDRAGRGRHSLDQPGDAADTPSVAERPRTTSGIGAQPDDGTATSDAARSPHGADRSSVPAGDNAGATFPAQPDAAPAPHGIPNRPVDDAAPTGTTIPPTGTAIPRQSTSATPPSDPTTRFRSASDGSPVTADSLPSAPSQPSVDGTVGGIGPHAQTTVYTPQTSAPADPPRGGELPANPNAGTTGTSPAPQSSSTAGEFTSQAGSSAYTAGTAPQRAPESESAPYVAQTPRFSETQYSSMPGDPSPQSRSAPDARTEMFRGDDPRVQAARHQAPSGEYALPSWQGGAGQVGPQSGSGSGEFAQPQAPQYQPADPTRQYRPDGSPAQPDGQQLPPDNAATQQYRPDGAPQHQPPAGYQGPESGAGQQFPQPTGYQGPEGQQFQQPGYQNPAQFQGGPTVQPYQQQPGQGWGQQPGWGANPQQQHFQPPSLDNVPVKRVKKAPGSGWRKAVHHVSGGAINPGMSAEERRLQELVARIRQPVRGDYRIAVLSLKGGVGKTTTTTGLGSIFASIRGDRVIAVDANPDFGTLSQRVALQTRSTVRDLLLDPSIERYSDVRRHTSQSSSRLEVLASERDPAASESFNDEEYRAVARILQRFYNIILTDCGTGLMHSAMSGVLDLAHSLVLISSAAIDGARSAAATLDWLSLHGHDHLVRNAVVVINLPREGSPNVGVQQLREYFLSRCRAVHIIPFDEHLSEGAEIDLHRLHKTTKRAYVELAATVADEFGVDHHRFG
ncbi:MinD/ParA family ATP-binding protein [Nocardia asteroides]|uniref:MinD/ParA family ATP-binding protein n=1 Tax=Nocardia asteroides TaxID=1824 RepID=UPI003666B5A5